MPVWWYTRVGLVWAGVFGWCLMPAPVRGETVEILIMGDTQKMLDPNNGKQHMFFDTMDNIPVDPVTRDAAFILQMGDLVESDRDNSDRPAQYQLAQTGWRKLDGIMPYVLNVGNNDHAPEYLQYFPLSRYNVWPSFVDNFNDHINVAHEFSAGGVDWLVISLNVSPSGMDIDWADGVISNHPNHKAILGCHTAGINNAVGRMTKKHANMVLLLCGHTESEIKTYVGHHGNTIGWIKTCWHDADLDSYLCMIKIETTTGTMTGRYYSPYYHDYGDDPESVFYSHRRNPMNYDETRPQDPYDHPWTWSGFDFDPVASSKEARHGMCGCHEALQEKESGL